MKPVYLQLYLYTNTHEHNKQIGIIIIAGGKTTSKQISTCRTQFRISPKMRLWIIRVPGQPAVPVQYHRQKIKTEKKNEKRHKCKSNEKEKPWPLNINPENVTYLPLSL